MYNRLDIILPVISRWRTHKKLYEVRVRVTRADCGVPSFFEIYFAEKDKKNYAVCCLTAK
jgi:hypothetical protein